MTRQLFVVRQKQFELLLNKIVQEKRNSIPQHYLIIGQRGMGKSMMLKRMEVELRNEYGNQFIPLLFPEEQYNLKSLAEFWLNNLLVLIKSLKTENYPSEKLTEIARKRDEISKSSPEKASEEAYKYLISICKELRRRPVLLIDNIGLVFSQLDADNKNKQEQWALRKLLSENGAPIVVSAGITVTDDVINYSMPFYDFFQIQYLSRLSFEEFEILLKNLAIVTGSEDESLSSIQKNRPRQRALFDLTGGSPRTTVMLFKHIIRGFSGDIVDDLEILADEATPLFKAKFEGLPRQQQIIIDAIALNWDAISLNKLSEATRFAGNQLSPQLKRLADEGWIETTPADKKSRKALSETEGVIKGNAYFISERFFNIWYLLRYDILKEGTYCLSKFLECFYGKEELESMTDNLLKQEISSTGQMRLFMAMSKSEILEPQKRKQLEKNITKIFLENEGLRKEFGVSEKPAFDEFLEWDIDEFLEWDIKEIIELTAKVKTGDLRFWRHLGTFFSTDDQYEKAIICFDRSIEINPGDKNAWWWKGCALIGLHRFEEAIACFDKAIELDPKDSLSWHIKGYALRNLQRFEEAIACYDKAIELDPESSSSWHNKGYALNELQRFDEAITCCEKAIELDPKSATSWNNKGYALKELQRFEEAIACFDKAIELNPKYSAAWNNKGYALIELRRYKDASFAYEKARSIRTDSIPYKFHLVFLYRDKLDEMNKAMELFGEIEKEINSEENRKYICRYFLHKTMFELYDQNKGTAKEYLSQAFDVLEKENGIASMANEYWWTRFGSVVVGLGHGSWLLAILEEKGYDAVLSPYYTAIQAAEIEKQNSKEDAEIYLKNRALEISEPARTIFAQIKHHID